MKKIQKKKRLDVYLEGAEFFSQLREKGSDELLLSIPGRSVPTTVFGACDFLSDRGGIDDICFDDYYNLQFAYPEFFMYKDQRGGYWWTFTKKGDMQRSLAFLFAYEMCNNKYK